jgi:hypothetical protein
LANFAVRLLISSAPSSAFSATSAGESLISQSAILPSLKQEYSLPTTPESRSIETRFISAFITALVLLFLVLTVSLLSLHFVSYDQAKHFFDLHIAAHVFRTDKSYLTQQDHNRLFARLPAAACVFGFCGLTLLLFRRKLTNFLIDIPTECAALHFSFDAQPHERRETRLEMATVFTIFAIGVFLRAWHVNRAVRYDEAWSYLEFASKPLVLGLSNYRAPNNHLLNTLLVHFSTALFGNSPVAIRLPALFAGCLVIPATWFVTRALYGSLPAIFAAGCVSALPTFIEFSVNARGYALQWLSILGMIWLGYRLLEKPSSKIGWLGFVLTAVLGIYSIPTTLIPLAGIFAWILLSTSVDGTTVEFKMISKDIALAGLAIALISSLLYVPPLIVRGFGAVTAQDVADWQQPQFIEGLKNLARCAWRHWTEGVPRAILAILLVGFAIALLSSRKISRNQTSRNPLSITIVLWIPAAIFIWAHHVFAFPRVWSYLLLSASMIASTGLSLLPSLAFRDSRAAQVVLAGVASIVLAAVVGTGIIKERALFTTNETGTIIDTDEIVDFLSAHLHPGDALVSNAIIQYQLLRRSPQLYYSLASPKGATHLVAVVVKSTGENEVCDPERLRALMAAQDAADPRVLSSQVDFHAYAPPRLLARFLTSTAYSLNRTAD